VYVRSISLSLSWFHFLCVFIFVLLGKTSVDKPLLEHMNKKLNTNNNYAIHTSWREPEALDEESEIGIIVVERV